MLGITTYTKSFLRLATILGFVIAALSALIGIVCLILKLVFWDRYIAGMAPLTIGVFLLNAVELFFIGLLGEYVININTRVLHRPLVVEEKRLNFDEDEAKVQKENGQDA